MGRTPHTPTRLRLWGVRPIRLRHAGYRCIRTDTPAFPSYIYIMMIPHRLLSSMRPSGATARAWKALYS